MTELNEVYRKKRHSVDFSDMGYWRDHISINDDNMNFLENIAEPEEKAHVLSEEERVKRDTLWKDIKFICGGNLNPDFYIMYARYYLGHSFREIAKTFGKGTFANTIVAREKKILNKLKFLYCKPCDGITCCKNKECKHKVVGNHKVCPKCGSTEVSYTSRVPHRTSKSNKL